MDVIVRKTPCGVSIGPGLVSVEGGRLLIGGVDVTLSLIDRYRDCYEETAGGDVRECSYLRLDAVFMGS